MKREQSKVGNGGVRKKKGKMVVAEKERVEVAGERGGDVGKDECGMVVLGDETVVGNLELEEWPAVAAASGLGLLSGTVGVVDEQMSWGTFGCQFWDMAFVGEAYYNDLYCDVLDDYDIWNLKGIKEIPDP